MGPRELDTARVLHEPVSPSGAANTPTDAMESEPLAIGQSIGRYIILHRAGKGGMAFVYAAYDPELDRKVAIKLLRTRAHARAGAETTLAEEGLRALREAQALAKLSHPHVLPVFDVGTFEGRVFFATEFVEGGTLQDWLDAGSHSIRDILRIFAGAGRGLAAAHARGFVHRDFKPHNVMVGRDEQVRVMDFGIVRMGDGLEDDALPNSLEDDTPSPTPEGQPTRIAPAPEHLTGAGIVMGTPHYMAPEQHRRSDVGAAADQYSFCVALYLALFGVHPFAGVAQHKLHRMKQAMRFAPAAADRRVPRWLARIVLRGLEAAPERRWPSMDALLDALASDPWKARRRVGAATLTALMLSGAIAGYVNWQHDRAAICSGGKTRVASAWNDERKQLIERSFLSGGIADGPDILSRVQHKLDLYASAWASAHEETCEATNIRHEQSEQLLDKRMACLDTRLRDLRALVDVFVDADSTVVKNAVLAVHKLPALDPCSDIDGLQSSDIPPPSPEIAARVERVSEALAAAKALQIAGRTTDALPITRNAVDEANALAYAPLLARSVGAHAMNLVATGQMQEAEQQLMEAAWLAEGAGLHEEMLLARTVLIYVVGYALGRFDDGLWWSRHAEAGLRAWPDARARARLDVNRGSLFMANGNFAAAYERYVAAARELPVDSPDIVIALSNAAAAAIDLERPRDALVHVRRALALGEAIVGPSHTHRGLALQNEGVILTMLGRYAEAKRSFEQALAVFERAGASASDYTGHALYAFVGWSTAQQRWDEAARQTLAALAVLERAPGRKHPHYAEALATLAFVRAKQGQFEQAEKLGREALEIFAEVGPDSVARQDTLVALGHTLLALDRTADAEAAFEAAAQAASARPPRTATLAELDFGRAQILVRTHGIAAHTRALDLARRALTASNTLHTLHDAQRSTIIEAWIAELESSMRGGGSRVPDRTR